jgi:hypothetical protein
VDSEWERNEIEQDYGWNPPLGEVRDTRRFAPWVQRPQGAIGGHVCGDPAWFAQGVPVDPARPPVLYTADGLPVCCRPGRGLLLGGGVGTGPPGGLLLGGVPPNPIQGGGSCAVAGYCAFGTQYTQPVAPIPPGNGNLWFASDPVGVTPRVVHLAAIPSGNPEMGATIYVGASCGTMLNIGGMAPTASFNVIGWPAGWFIVVEVLPADPTVGVDGPSFTIRIE